MEQILSDIQQADSAQLNDIILTVVARYRQLYPGWEVMFLSLPKDDADLRRKTVDRVCALLKESP